MRSHILLFIAVLAGLSGCTETIKVDFLKAKKEAESGALALAVETYGRVIKRDSESPTALDAAREGAQLSQYFLKDYKKAIEFKKFIVLHSDNESERIQCQKDIANMYFDNLQDYREAIISYNKLLIVLPPGGETIKTRLNLARAHLYQNDFYQAESEIEALLKVALDNETKFEALMTRGSIALTLKQNAKAITIFKDLLKEYPDLAIKNSLPFMIAVGYEEVSDFKNAIGTLESYRSSYPNKQDYLDIRIKRLKERQLNQPGARGLRK